MIENLIYKIENSAKKEVILKPIIIDNKFNPLIKKNWRVYFYSYLSGKEASRIISFFPDTLSEYDFLTSTELKKKRYKEKTGYENPSQNPLIKKKKQKTCLKNYGVEYPQQSFTVKEKTKNNNIKKYEVENVSQVEAIKEKEINTKLKKYGNLNNFEKIKETNLERYGTEIIISSNKIREKSEKTCLERYGVKNVFESSEIQNKIKETNLSKYGVKIPSKSSEIQNKIKETNLSKYGVENTYNLQSVKEKMINTKKENVFESLKNIDYLVEPLFNKEEYIGQYKNGPIRYKWKCKKCGNEFEDNFHSRIPRCPNCFPGNVSVGEKEVFNFVKEYCNMEVLENRRDIISPYELDIYIPELKLAIEYNGDYWHNLEETKKRDEIKKELCVENEIDLIYIWESSWLENKETIKEQLKDIIEIIAEEL